MKNLKLLIILIGISFISCSENDSTSITLEDNVPGGSCEVDDPRLTDPNYEGTICCFQRNSALSLNTPVIYEYLTNLSDPSVTWQIESGDIQIVSGQDSKIITINLGENFEGGIIKVLGTSTDGLACSEAVVITTN
jgi:hypothetical protein